MFVPEVTSVVSDEQPPLKFKVPASEDVNVNEGVVSVVVFEIGFVIDKTGGEVSLRGVFGSTT